MTGQVLNYHVRHSVNIGDILSAPLNYFEFPGFQCETRDIDDLPTDFPPDLSDANPRANNPKGKHLILGGGGLLFSRYLGKVTAPGHHPNRGLYIFWGVGQQWYDGDPSLTFRQFDYQPYLKGVDLVGVRDYQVGLPWVPCPSCLHPAFDKPRTPQREFVVFSHKKFRIQVPGVPALTNEVMDLETVLDFLGSGETILTSSFHGAYWGTLLGRRVLAFPFSSKFYGLKHAPAFYPIQKWRQKGHRLALFGKTFYERFEEDWFECPMEGWRSLLGQCRPYPESLQECRDRNRWFYQEVLKRLPEP